MENKCDNLPPLTQFEKDRLGEDYEKHRKLEKMICENHRRLLFYLEKNRTEALTVEESSDVDSLLFETQIWAGQLVNLRESHELFSNGRYKDEPSPIGIV